jgi:hypothetical protein
MCRPYKRVARVGGRAGIFVLTTAVRHVEGNLTRATQIKIGDQLKFAGAPHALRREPLGTGRQAWRA